MDSYQTSVNQPYKNKVQSFRDFRDALVSDNYETKFYLDYNVPEYRACFSKSLPHDQSR
jgi:hypothetical protein